MRRFRGEATWTDIYKVWREYGHGKSTLSKTLDAMVEKRAVERVPRLSADRRGRGSHSQIWYVLTVEEAVKSLKESKMTTEEILVMLQERSQKEPIFPGYEASIRDLMLKSEDMSKSLQDFEKKYNRIKKEGQLVASTETEWDVRKNE